MGTRFFARITVQENAPVHPNTARNLRMECFGPGDAAGRPV